MAEETKRGTILDAKEKKQIAILAAQGKTPYAIGKVLGRSDTTVKKYLQKPDIALQVKEIEERLADKFEEVTEKVLNAITPADIEKASLRDKAVSAGILLDKSRLIRGQSTQNIAVMMASAVLEADSLVSGSLRSVEDAEEVSS